MAHPVISHDAIRVDLDPQFKDTKLKAVYVPRSSELTGPCNLIKFKYNPLDLKVRELYLHERALHWLVKNFYRFTGEPVSVKFEFNSLSATQQQLVKDAYQARRETLKQEWHHERKHCGDFTTFSDVFTYTDQEKGYVYQLEETRGKDTITRDLKITKDGKELVSLKASAIANALFQAGN